MEEVHGGFRLLAQFLIEPGLFTHQSRRVSVYYLYPQSIVRDFTLAKSLILGQEVL